MNLKTVASEPPSWPLQTTLAINITALYPPSASANTPGPESTFLCLKQSQDGSNSKIKNKKLKQLTMFLYSLGHINEPFFGLNYLVTSWCMQTIHLGSKWVETPKPQ